MSDLAQASMRSRCWAAISSRRRRSSDGRAEPKLTVCSGSTKCRARPYIRGNSMRPMLWNSNFFMTLGSMKILRLLTDVWLPDFKFGPGRCVMALAKTPWYWETATRNLALMASYVEQASMGRRQHFKSRRSNGRKPCNTSPKTSGRCT